MTHHRIHIDVLLLSAALAVSLGTAHRVRAAVVAAPADAVAGATTGASAAATKAGAVPGFSDDTTDYATFVVENDLFRLANVPSAVRFSAATEGTGATQPAMVRPQLTVKAIIGGPPWQAMVDGIPGAASTIVRSGQVVGPLTIRNVGRDTVTVQGMDTTWKLTLHGGHP